MYIPKINLATDENELITFMRRYSFATIITSKDGYPVATHLPFLISGRDEKIILTSHFAKANTHWQIIENNISLIIFMEPHAYISPKHYDKELNVPTWNYIAVHAYGKGKLISDEKIVADVLEKTILTYEAAYKTQYDSLPVDYKTNLSKGIVAFEIEVTDLQGKKKLSQNKTENEQRNIIQSLSSSKLSTDRDIAFYMQACLHNKQNTDNHQ